jgi:pimeloyl-ACP methyl ester carboxylesterase
MPFSLALASAAVRAIGAMSPGLAGALALRLFLTTRPRMRVSRDAVGIVRDARHERLVVNGRHVRVAQWGTEGPVLVLLHGWRGRAAQFWSMVPALRAEGYRVVAPDVAGHGDSPGGRVDVRDWLAVLAELQRRHGRFRAVIGHSFGGFAALTAARLGFETDAVVALAGAGRPAAYLDQFARMLKLAPATRLELERCFLARLGETAETFAARYDGVAHPLAPATPLLLVHGGRDRQMPPENSRHLAAVTPHARLVTVPEVGHARIIGHHATVDAVLALLAAAPQWSDKRAGMVTRARGAVIPVVR